MHVDDTDPIYSRDIYIFGRKLAINETLEFEWVLSYYLSIEISSPHKTGRENAETKMGGKYRNNKKWYVIVQKTSGKTGKQHLCNHVFVITCRYSYLGPLKTGGKSV